MVLWSVLGYMVGRNDKVKEKMEKNAKNRADNIFGLFFDFML